MNTRSHHAANWQTKDYPYYRKIWIKVVSVLLASAFLPLFLIGGGMYYFSTSAFKESTMDQVRLQAQNQKGLIDHLFEERILELQYMASHISKSSPEIGRLGGCLADLGYNRAIL
jgi:uncharacterized membrane protein YjjP (DUF1212 family)